jgi:PAS domain S-box-containing protein/putative nucleotidyltransferase with HDIG domain
MAEHELGRRGRLSRSQLRAERERAHKRIADQEAGRWRTGEYLIDSLAEHLQDGFVLLSPQGVHLDVNPAFCAMTGYERDELIGDGLPHPYWPPEERDAIERKLRRNLETPEGTTAVTFMRRSGERFPVLIAPSVVRGADGEPFYAFATIKDVSEQRHAEQALRESEARFRSVVENAPVGMFQSTLEGRFIYVNPACAATFGCATPAEMIAFVNGRGIAEAIYEDPDERRRVLGDVHAAGGEWVAFKSRLRHRDGSVHTGLVYLCERRGAGSDELSLFGFVQDVTAQEQATRELERTAQLLSHGESLAHVGSWEWDIVANVCTVSAEWQRLHGLTGDVLSNEEIHATCHEDDRPVVRAALERAAAGHPYRADHRIVHPVTHAVRHLMTYGEPRFDAAGGLATVIGASLDVTERVQAEEALRERKQRLRRALQATVAALGATVTMRDPYTADHQRRVAQLACLVAERLGWNPERVETLRTAALVHDIGKIAIPAEILAKPARLTVDEYALIKGHPRAAYEILQPIEFEGPVAEIVLQHHERLDGSGYPRGLRGDEILAEARVLAIADVVEAMVTHRPYRPALPATEAVAEIELGLGGRYDGAAGNACLRLLQQEAFAFTE